MKTTRSSGIILHLTSLPGAYGIGDMGKEAYQFVDFLAECGISFWQLLPLNPIAKRTGYSPYSSTSAFAGNTYLISPDLLVEEGFLDKNALQNISDFKAYKVEFDKAVAFKDQLLQHTFNH